MWHIWSRLGATTLRIARPINAAAEASQSHSTADDCLVCELFHIASPLDLTAPLSILNRADAATDCPQ
jgi:hypothetical protein